MALLEIMYGVGMIVCGMFVPYEPKPLLFVKLLLHGVGCAILGYGIGVGAH